MNEHEIKELQTLIEERSGIHFRAGDRDKFVGAIEARLGELRIADATQYHHLLSSAGRDDAEWQHLTAHLVPGESYFFRDTGQIALIQNSLLPELIAARRAAGDLRLRIWSAGCSTGEEPYSLAALVYDLIPDAVDWRILILGTDPNAEAIERARSGRYTDWSFRQVSADRRSRFFLEESGTYRVLPEIQALVSFRVHDLHADPFPEAASLNTPTVAGTTAEERDAIRDMDLIVCRNVFIYLKPAVIAGIVRRMEDTLIVGGMLVTGHGELSEARPRHLITRVYPASILYQKTSEAPMFAHPNADASVTASTSEPQVAVPGDVATSPEAAVPDPVPVPDPAPVAVSPDHPVAIQETPQTIPPSAPDPAPTGDALAQARERLRAGQYDLAVELLDGYRMRHPADPESGYLLARAYANLGRHEAAALVLNEILKTDPFGVPAYFLLAQISEAEGDPLRAMDLLKRSIYVDAEYMPGYLELGLLYDREGDAERARRMLTSALELLKGLPPETEIEEYNGESAAHLIARVEASLP